jgi:hypothetical protein
LVDRIWIDPEPLVWRSKPAANHSPDLEPAEADMAGIGDATRRCIIAEDVRDFQRGGSDTNAAVYAGGLRTSTAFSDIPGFVSFGTPEAPHVPARRLGNYDGLIETAC